MGNIQIKTGEYYAGFLLEHEFYFVLAGFLSVSRVLHLYAFLSAIDNAIATACLCGRPALVSVRMFSEIALRVHPFISGILSPPLVLFELYRHVR